MFVATLFLLLSHQLHAITIMRYEFDNCQGPYTNLTFDSRNTSESGEDRGAKCYWDGQLAGKKNPESYATSEYNCDLYTGLVVAKVWTENTCPGFEELIYPVDPPLEQQTYFLEKKYRHSKCIQGAAGDWDHTKNSDNLFAGQSLYIDCSEGSRMRRSGALMFVTVIAALMLR